MDTFNHREHISLALNMSSETNNLSVYDLTAASHEGDSSFEEGLTPIGESFDGGSGSSEVDLKKLQPTLVDEDKDTELPRKSSNLSQHLGRGLV